jgi:hypothetical protein
MKNLLIIFIFIFFSNCSKPQTVVICGDHVCVNKAEAEQYFEDNLTIEVKIIDSNKKNKLDLVELNLKDNSKENKKINIVQKKSTKEEVKILTNDEIIKIKKDIKEKKKKKETAKKVVYKENKEKKRVTKKNKIPKKNIKKIVKKKINNQEEEILDVCTVIENCNIDEISKFLLKQGKEKGFPDITVRE